MMDDDKLRLQGYDEGEKTPVVSNLLIKRLIVNILYQMMKMYKIDSSSVRENYTPHLVSSARPYVFL